MKIEVQGITGRLRPVKGNVFVTDIEVGDRLVNGLIVPDDNGNDRGIRPRWARVAAVGEGVDLVEGQYVLIEHGRWTWGMEISTNGVKAKLHAADPKGLLMVSDTHPLAA